VVNLIGTVMTSFKLLLFLVNVYFLVCNALLNQSLCASTELEVVIKTGKYATHISWELQNAISGEVYGKRNFGYYILEGVIYVDIVCIQDADQVIFTINDHGYEMPEEVIAGYYKVLRNGEELASGEGFGSCKAYEISITTLSPITSGDSNLANKVLSESLYTQGCSICGESNEITKPNQTFNSDGHQFDGMRCNEINDAVSSGNLPWDECRILSPLENICGCRKIKDKIFIGGILDTTSFSWVEEIFEFVLDLINTKDNGWHDDIFPERNTLIEGKVVDSNCDENTALKAYWDDLRSEHTSIHGLVGCRCSGASSMVSRISSLENIAQVSPSATSAKLSDKEEYATFSRMVSPDDARGQVGAMVNMLRSFGWSRITILNTDTKYAKDFANEFQKLWLVKRIGKSGEVWDGEIYYSKTFLLDDNGQVDMNSVQQVLQGVPTEDPRINSKVILLISHETHAYPILQKANVMKFQPDTIWVGPQAWGGRDPPETSWIPPFPGYLGLVPYFNENVQYHDFLNRLQRYQAINDMDVWKRLPDYTVANIIDSILSLTKALSNVDYADRTNGNIVSASLRKLEFDGVSGDVRFTETGDRRDPLFTVYNLQKENGKFEWKAVATVGVDKFSFNYRDYGICFAEIGCRVDGIPSDKYPVPPIPIQTWVVIVLPIIILLFLLVAYRYWRTKQKKKALKKSISSIQQKMKIDTQLDDLNAEIEAAKRKKESLIKKRFYLQEKPKTWTASDKTLVELSPKIDDEYWNIFDKLRQDMPDAYISKLWRVQNSSLWTYYSFHKDRFSSMKVSKKEQSVWHGTSELDPTIIYNCKQDGFMMQFSQAGFWGRGIYFADKASYSHSYAYKPNVSRSSINTFSVTEERPTAKAGEREMFLAKLLIGSVIFIDRDESLQKASWCRKLTVPPVNPATNLKYNTVSGTTAGSKVWIVYENGRAYPEYLVRYYRSSKRDPERTPFESRSDAGISVEKNENDSSPEIILSHHWEYYGDSGWERYSARDESKLEHAFQCGSKSINIKTTLFNYRVNFSRMKQRNLDHQNHRERDIRRVEVQDLGFV